MFGNILIIESIYFSCFKSWKSKQNWFSMKLNVVADFLQRDESRWLYVCRSLSQNQQQLHAIKIWHIFCPNSKKLYLPYFCQLYDLINGFGIHNLTEESGFDLPKCQFGLVFWDLQTRSNCSTLTRLLWITFVRCFASILK